MESISSGTEVSAVTSTDARRPAPTPGARRWVPSLLEALTLVVVELAYFSTCYSIRLDPLDRIAQISAIASMGYRFVLFAVPLIAILIYVAKYRPQRWDLAVRLVCAALVGLVSAAFAGGIVCILHGTPYGIGGDRGDVGVLARWAEKLRQGGEIPSNYPPLQAHLLAWLADLFHSTTFFAVRQFQLLNMLLFFPLGYAAWRVLVRPTWALALGVVAGLPLVELYRGYPLMVLLTFLPVLMAFLQTLQTSASRSLRQLVIRGAIFGAVIAVHFLLYSGWFAWSVPGVLVVVLVVFPWRTGWKHGVVFGSATLGVFLALSGYTIYQLLVGPEILDGFFYFENKIEPMYIAMWRAAMPGLYAEMWPPLGELGGVGVFTIALCIGWATSLWLGSRHVVVMTASWIMVGAWLMRLRLAGKMWSTHLVQLYPRTTAEILYCLLILSVFAIALGVDRRRTKAAEDSVLHSPWATIGALVGFTLVAMSSVSAITDRYMARDRPDDWGALARLSHITPVAGKTVTKRATATAGSGNPQLAIDQKPGTVYESAVSDTPDHEEWLDVQMVMPVEFSRFVLIGAGDGFPVDFAIDVWDGLRWVPVMQQTGVAPPPPRGELSLPLPHKEITSRFRFRVTRLGKVATGYQLRIGEIQAFR